MAWVDVARLRYLPGTWLHQLCLSYDDNLTMTDLSHMMEAARLLGGGQVSHPHVEDLEAHVENNGSHVHVVATDLCSEAVICNGQEGARDGIEQGEVEEQILLVGLGHSRLHRSQDGHGA